jgi:tubby-related protein 1
MQSASIMRTKNDACFGQNMLTTVENSMTRVQMMSHPPHFQQQIFRQTNHMVQGISADRYSSNFGNEGMTFMQENALLPMTNSNAYPSQMQQMVAYDYRQSQSNRNARHSYANDACNNQKLIHYRASGDDMSELTDTRMEGSQQSYRNEPPRYVSMEEDERSSNRRSTFSFIDIEEEDQRSMVKRERSESKLRRSNSSRSLSFNNHPDQEGGKLSRHVSSSNASKVSSGESSSREESEQRIVHFLNEMESINALDVDNPTMMRLFLTRPCPKGMGMLRCSIKRNKGIKNKLFPEYRVYLKESNAFLMTSKKRMGNATSNYLISMGRNDFDNRHSPNVLGKLRSNFLGTEYTIYDGGRNPQYESSNDDEGDGKIRCELGAIFYAASTTLGSKGPRKIKACIAKLDDENKATKVWQPTNEDDDKMVSVFKDEKLSQRDLMSFVNKAPSWNKEIKAYALNFSGRVTMASVKNFQLINESDRNEIYLQFGRTGKDEFILDLQWPLSPLQAFAFALSSFDSKLGCD